MLEEVFFEVKYNYGVFNDRMGFYVDDDEEDALMKLTKLLNILLKQHILIFIFRKSNTCPQTTFSAIVSSAWVS